MTDEEARAWAAGVGSLAGRLGLAVAALVSTVVVLEIALRVAAPVSYSSDLRWIADGHVKARLDPQQTAVNEHGNRVQLNSLGFRGRSAALASVLLACL